MALSPIFATKEFESTTALPASDLNQYVSNSLLYLHRFQGEQATDWPLSPAVNQRVYRSDFRADFVYDGTTWMQTSVGSFDGIYPSSPIVNLRVYRTDLAQERVWNGSVWVTTTSVASGNVTGVLPAANGGTGVNNGSNTLTIPASGTAVLRSGSGTAGRVALWSNANEIGNDGNLTYGSNTLNAPNLNVSGNVIAGLFAIGVTTPARPVHIRHVGASMLFQRLDGALPGFFLSVFSLDNLDTPTKVFYLGGIGNDSVGFRDHGTTEGGGGTVRLRVTGTGSVLIGRDTGLTGAGDLDVNGNLRIGNNLTLTSGTLIVSSGGISAVNGYISGQNLSASNSLGTGGNAYIGGNLSVTGNITGSASGGSAVRLSNGAAFFAGVGYANRPSVIGSRDGNPALTSLLIVLDSYGLIYNNTTA